MKQGTSLFTRILDHIWPRDFAAEVDHAYAKFAAQDAEVTEHNRLALYYKSKADNIDPHKDWWGFATAMEKWRANEEDAVIMTIRADARYKKYETLLERQAGRARVNK